MTTNLENIQTEIQLNKGKMFGIDSFAVETALPGMLIFKLYNPDNKDPNLISDEILTIIYEKEVEKIALSKSEDLRKKYIEYITELKSFLDSNE